VIVNFRAEIPQATPNFEVLLGAVLGAMVGGGILYLYQERASLSCPSSSENSDYAMGVVTGPIDKDEADLDEDHQDDDIGPTNSI
jgi:hypothetical protein